MKSATARDRGDGGSSRHRQKGTNVVASRKAPTAKISREIEYPDDNLGAAFLAAFEDTVLVVDPDWQIVFVNSATKQLAVNSELEGSFWDVWSGLFGLCPQTEIRQAMAGREN